MIPNTPTWITPNEPGLISNGGGTPASPAATFSAPLTVRYRSPGGSSDGPVAARYRLTQTKLKGTPVTPTLAYDSGWGRPAVGPTGATSPLPGPVRTTPQGAIWAEAVGRVYVFDQNQNTVWSAPVSGLSVGTWRMETPPPTRINMMSDPVLIGGQIYVLTTAGFLQATLNGDGSIGSWTWAGSSTTNSQSAAGMPIPNSITQWCGLGGLDFGPGLGGALIAINPDGSTWIFSVTTAANTITSVQAGPTLPVAFGSSVGGGTILCDTSYYPGTNFSWTTAWVYVITGTGNATYWTTLNLPGSSGTLAAMGSSWNAGASLPNNAFKFAVAATPRMLTGGRLNGPEYGKEMDIFLFGGTQGGSAPIIYDQILAISGVGLRTPGTTWTSIQPASYIPTIQGAACAWPMPGANPSLPAFVVGQFGGYTDPSGGSPNLAVQSFFPGQMSSAPAVAQPYSLITNLTNGPGSVLPEAVLDPAVPDSYLYTFQPHLPNATSWGGPYDGDEYTVEVAFASQQTGDPSPPALSTVSFAKPPMITGVTPTGTIANGNPTVSFAYQAGSYGGPMLNWRAIISLGTTTIADSGLQTGPTTWTPGVAPCLPPGHTYGLQITVNSSDAPVTSNDTASYSYLGTFTPQYAVPDPPSAFTCTQDTARGAITATWTNPAGTAFNRIYYRISGSTAWWLLQDSITAQTSMTLTLIDQLALNQTYDFAVTALDTTQSLESAIEATLANGDMEAPGPAGLTPTAQSVFTEGFEEQTTYNTVLWRSLGSDSQNSLDGWTSLRGGATMYQNTLRMGNQGFVAAGHPDWQDGTFTARFTIPRLGTQAWPWMGVHVSEGLNSWVSLEWVPAASAGTANPALRINSYNTQSSDGVILAGPQVAQAGATSYWFSMTCTGHTYTGRLYSDNAGAIGTLLGTISTTIPWTSVGAGRVALACDQGEVDWGGSYANVCTWTGPVPQGWQPDVPAGTPQSSAATFTDTFANLSNWNQGSSAVAATVSGSVVTIPAGAGIFSKQAFTDGVWTARITSSSNPANCPWIAVRATPPGTSASALGTWPANALIFQWSPGNNSAEPFALYKSVGGNLTLLATSMQNFTVAASTAYWVRCIMQGPNVTAQIYSDSSGAMGSLLTSCTGYAPDAVLRQGVLGVSYSSGDTGSLAVGGAYSNVCHFDSFTQASGVSGEPAFAASGWYAQSGQTSLSIYQAPGQNIVPVAGNAPSWRRTNESGSIAVTQGDSYAFAVQVNSSDGGNTAMLVEEYNSGGSLVKTTALEDIVSGLTWNPSVVVTAEGSSGDYTNTSRGTLLRVQPSFLSTVVGETQEGQPLIVLGAAVSDQQVGPSIQWYPVAYDLAPGGVAFLWTADAGATTVGRLGYRPSPLTLSDSLIPQATTTSLAVRLATTGPGLHYFDQLVVTASQNVQPALFKSFGSDATGTLAAWTSSGGSTSPAYFAAVSADQPAGWWRMDDSPGTGSATDYSGNGIAATLVGGITERVAGNVTGDPYGMTFDGSTGYMTLPNTVPVGAPPYSVELMFKAVGAGRVEYLFETYASTGGAFSVWINGSNVAAAVGSTSATTSTTWADGNWHHLVVTVTATTLTIYIDGASRATATGTLTMPLFDPTSPYTSTLGSYNAGQTDYLSGSMSQVAVYPTALSSTRVSAHYTAITAAGVAVAASIASHVVTLQQGATIYAGHPDWTDSSTRVRFQAVANSGFSLMVRYNAATGQAGVQIQITVSATGLINFAVVDALGVNVLNQNYAGTLNAWYWVAATLQGAEANGTLCSDSGGAPTTTLLSGGGTIPSGTNGQVALQGIGGSASAVIGGAYPETFAVLPIFLPANWSMVNQSGWTVWEPSFCWDAVTVESGTYSLSITSPVGTGVAYWVTQLPTEPTAIAVTPSTQYNFTSWLNIRTGTTGNVKLLQWSAAGATLSTAYTPATGSGWREQVLAVTTNASAAYASVRGELDGAGTLWFDNVAFAPVVPANVSTGNLVQGPEGQTIFHVPGNNGQTVMAVYFGTYMRSQQGGPQVNVEFETTQIPTMGTQAPVVRYGVQKWRQVTTNALFMSPAQMAAYVRLRDAAWNAGQPLVYRDTAGRMFVAMESNQNHQSMHEPSNYRARQDITNVLWEVVNTTAPYTTATYVLGRRALVNGSLPALDPSEEI